MKVGIYLVSTPIGNMNEANERMKETISNADFVYVEDTRVFKSLSTKLEIRAKNPPRILNSINEKKIGEEILGLLNDQASIAIISDAGYPLICDPGYSIVKKALNLDFEIYVINCASAIINALLKSSFTPYPFSFYGYLDPKDNVKFSKKLKQAIENNTTSIFFIAVHDIKRLLLKLKAEAPNQEFFLARELTKIYETGIKFKGNEPPNDDEIVLKGEFVLVMNESLQEKGENSLKLILDYEEARSKSINSAAKFIASKSKISKSEAYKILQKVQDNTIK